MPVEIITAHNQPFADLSNFSFIVYLFVCLFSCSSAIFLQLCNPILNCAFLTEINNLPQKKRV